MVAESAAANQVVKINNKRRIVEDLLMIQNEHLVEFSGDARFKKLTTPQLFINPANEKFRTEK